MIFKMMSMRVNNQTITRLLIQSSSSSSSIRLKTRKHSSSSSYSKRSISSSSSSSSSLADINNNKNIEKNNKNVLIIISFLPLSPSQSAAGVRTRAIIKSLENKGFTVHYLSASSSMYAKSIGKKEKDFLQSEFESFEHFTQYGMIPNRGDLFEEALMKLRPTVVMFDRFLAEEAFSFRVRAVCPEALRVLDMQDVHALRRERERIVTSSSSSSSSRNTIVDSINAKPCAMDGDFSREISAIYRSDLTFVCSQVEMEILQNVCGIDREKLVLAPFFETIDEKRGHCEETIVPFKKRKDFFVSIGTFNHAPNVDGLRYLKNDIWPLIRKKLGTGVQFHAYGASCLPKHMDELNDEKNGFFIKGFCEDISTTLGEAKILLAPLRFGAGIKGKVIEAFKYGTPVITTPIGSEGIGVPSKYSDNSYSEYKWGGTFDCVTPEAFANAAVESFTNEALWTEQSMRAFELRKTLFDKEKTIPPILDAIEKKRENLDAVRKEDFIGQAFWHQSNRSTDFFSRWIELKETGANTGSSLS